MEDEELQNKLSIDDLLQGDNDSDEAEMFEREDPISDWEDDRDEEDVSKGCAAVTSKGPAELFTEAASSSSSHYAGRHSTLLKAIHEQENTSSDDIQTSKKRLSRLLAREKSQRMAASVKHRYSPKTAKFSIGTRYSPLKSSLTNRPKLSFKGAYRSSIKPIRVGGDSERALEVIQEEPRASKANRFQTIKTIINETDRLDASVLRNISEDMSKVYKSVLSSSGYSGMIPIIQNVVASLSYFGVAAVQLWIKASDDSLWSIRSDGHKVLHPSSRQQTFFNEINLENALDAKAVIYPSSLGWSLVQDIITSLLLPSEKALLTWRQFRLFNIPSTSTRMVIVVADSVKYDSTLSSRAEICDQYVQKLALVINMKGMTIDHLQHDIEMQEAQKLLQHQASVEMRLTKTAAAVADVATSSEVGHRISQAGVDAIDCPFCWCVYSPDNDPLTLSDDTYCLYRGHERSKPPTSLQIMPRSSTLLKSLFEGFLLKPTIHNLSRKEMIELCGSTDELIVNSTESEMSVILRVINVQISSRMVSSSGAPPAPDVSIIFILSDGQDIEVVLQHIKELCIIGHGALERIAKAEAEKMMVNTRGISTMLLDSLSQRTNERQRGKHRHLRSLASAIQSIQFSKMLDVHKCHLLISNDMLGEDEVDVENVGFFNNVFARFADNASTKMYTLTTCTEQNVSGILDFTRENTIYLSRSSVHRENRAFLVSQKSRHVYTPVVDYPMELDSLCASLGFANNLSVIVEPIVLKTGVALLIVALNLREMNDAGVCSSLLLQSDLRGHLSCALDLAIQLSSKDDLLLIDEVQKRLISNYRKRLSKDNYFRLWTRGVFSRGRIAFGAYETIGKVMDRYANAHTDDEDFTSELVKTLNWVFQGRNVLYEKTQGSLSIEEAMNRVFLSSNNNTSQIDLVGIVEKGSFCGYIKISSKSHISVHKGDNEYNDVEIRTLQVICAMLANLDSLFQRGPLFGLLHSKLPALLLGNSGEKITLNLPTSLPQISSCLDNINDINKVVLDMKQKRLDEMQEACKLASEQITLEKATIDAMRQKLSSSLALTILSMQMGDSKNLQDLSLIIKAKLPTVLGSAKAHLLLPSGEESQTFRTISTMPKSAEDGQQPPMDDEEFSISVVQLQAIADYGTQTETQTNDPAAVAIKKLSKIVLIDPASKAIVGVVLCFDTDNSGRWDGLVEVLINALSAYIISSISRFELYGTMASVRTALLTLEAAQKENTALQDTLTKSTEKCAALSAEIEQTKMNANIEKSRHQQLVDMINKHVDEKISVRTYNIQEWLEDACKCLGATVYVIERRGGAYVCDKIPSLDLINAASEAVMSKNCIEALAEARLHQPDFVTNTFPALLIPNVHVPSYMSTTQACFAICRSNSRRFSEDEKEFLTCAINLSCRTLSIAESVPFTVEDYKNLEGECASAKSYLQRIQAAMKLSSALYEMKSTKDLFNLLESDFPSALHRSVGEENCAMFTVRPILYNPKSHSIVEEQRKDIQDFFKSDTLAASQIVLRELKPLRRRNKICFPVFSTLRGSGVTVLLFVETSLDLAISEEENISTNRTTSVEDLLINDEDENIISIIAQALSGAIENLRSLQGAIEGISQAGVAIDALKDQMASIEGSTAIEVASRLQYQETMNAAYEMLSLSQSSRCTIDLMLESIRRLAKRIISSENCCILVPYKGSLFATNSNDHADGSYRFQENSYYLYDAEKFVPTAILFEPVDVEYLSLQLEEIKISGVNVNDNHQSWLIRNLIEKSYDIEGIQVIMAPVKFDPTSSALVMCWRKDAMYSKVDIECLRSLAVNAEHAIKGMINDRLRGKIVELELEGEKSKHLDDFLKRLDESYYSNTANVVDSNAVDGGESLQSTNQQHNISPNATDYAVFINDLHRVNAPTLLDHVIRYVFNLSSKALLSGLDENSSLVGNGVRTAAGCQYQVELTPEKYYGVKMVVEIPQLSSSVAKVPSRGNIGYEFTVFDPTNEKLVRTRILVVTKLFVAQYESACYHKLLMDRRDEMEYSDANILKGIHIVSNISRFIHGVCSRQKGFHEISLHIVNSMNASFDMSVAICMKIEEGFTWLGENVPSWINGDLSPINIASSTGKVVLIGTESPNTAASQCIPITDSGDLPDICTILPFKVNNDASIILICTPKDGNFYFPMTQRLATLLHGLITPALTSFNSLVQARVTNSAKKLCAIVKRREQIKVYKALSAMKSVMVRRFHDRLGEMTTRLNKTSLNVSFVERQLADISESCRSINAATSLLKKGLVDVWDLASRSLASMLSSHVSLDGKLTLLGLTRGSSGGTNEVTEIGGNETSENMLKQMLGSKYFAFVRDVLMGTLTENIRKQTMYTMSKVDEGDGKKRELWFVPVRSIKKTLSVLIVHISIDNNFSADRQFLDAPQAIVGHFAAMFAPVFYAATVVEAHKVHEKEFEKAKDVQNVAIKEMSEEKSQFAQFVSALDLAGAAELEISSQTALVVDADAKIRENLHTFSMALKRIINRDVFIHLGPTLPTSKVVNATDFVERVLGERGEVLGTIVFSALEDGKLNSGNLHSPFITKALTRHIASRIRSVLENLKLVVDYQHSFHELEAAKVAHQELENALEENRVLTATGFFYRSLTDVIHKCLSFGVGGGDVSYLLKDVCVRMPSIIPSEATVSFALLECKNTDKVEFNWYHAEERQNFKHSHFPKSLETTDDIVDIATNLAKTCVERKAKSSLNINNPSTEMSDFEGRLVNASNQVITPTRSSPSKDSNNIVGKSAAENFMIATYPLAPPGGNATLMGVFQVILALPVNTRDLDDLCEDVTEAVAIALMISESRQSSATKITYLEEKISSMTLQLSSADEKILSCHREYTECENHRQELLERLAELDEEKSKEEQQIVQLRAKLERDGESVSTWRNESEKLRTQCQHLNHRVGNYLGFINNGIRVSLSSSFREILELSLSEDGKSFETSLISFVGIIERTLEKTMSYWDTGSEIHNNLVQVAAITREKGTNGSVFRTFQARSYNTLSVDNSSNQNDGYDGPPILLDRSAAAPHRFSTDNTSVIEKHFRSFCDSNEQHLTIVRNAPIALADLVGASDPLLSSAKRLSKHHGSNNESDEKICMLIASLMQNSSKAVVIRILFIDRSKDEDLANCIGAEVSQLCVAGYTMLSWNETEAERRIKENELKRMLGSQGDKAIKLQQLIEKNRSVHRATLREMCSLMDAPSDTKDGSAVRVNHPASLNPSFASLDTCLKILSLMRTLLRGEGQAVLLKDTSSGDETAYRVIYTGTAIRWTGVGQGEFGIINTTMESRQSAIDTDTSILQATMSEHKTLNLPSIHVDPRYRPVVDGLCAPETPYLAVPLRGRTGCIIGIIVVVRGHKGTAFSAEDIHAAEMVGAFSSLSLYWCHGMVSLHDKVLVAQNQLNVLESTVQRSATHNSTRLRVNVNQTLPG